MFSFLARKSSSLSETAELHALHSFPTRRSSDLAPVLRVPSWTPPALVDDTKVATAVWLSVRSTSLKDTRSEEHTSELQSRPKLVCRVLLLWAVMTGSSLVPVMVTVTFSVVKPPLLFETLT